MPERKGQTHPRQTSRTSNSSADFPHSEIRLLRLICFVSGDVGDSGVVGAFLHRTASLVGAIVQRTDGSLIGCCSSEVWAAATGTKPKQKARASNRMGNGGGSDAPSLDSPLPTTSANEPASETQDFLSHKDQNARRRDPI